MGDLPGHWRWLLATFRKRHGRLSLQTSPNMQTWISVSVLRASFIVLLIIEGGWLISSRPQIDVQEVGDVQAALKFSESTGVRLVIKNTGHDYIGRSSAPDSLTLLVSYRVF
jgi:hypothetical protein